MAKNNTKIIYEENEDILSLWRGRPSKASIEIGDFIIDIDSYGYVSGLEILNVSENLDIQPNFLEKIENISMSVLYKPNYVYIMLKVKLIDKEKEISIPLTINLGHKKVEKEQIIFSK